MQILEDDNWKVFGNIPDNIFSIGNSRLQKEYITDIYIEVTNKRTNRTSRKFLYINGSSKKLFFKEKITQGKINRVYLDDMKILYKDEEK